MIQSSFDFILDFDIKVKLLTGRELKLGVAYTTTIDKVMSHIETHESRFLLKTLPILYYALFLYQAFHEYKNGPGLQETGR